LISEAINLSAQYETIRFCTVIYIHTRNDLDPMAGIRHLTSLWT